MLRHITDPTIASDEVMNIHSVLLLRDMKTKVEVGFEVSVRSHEKLLELNIAVKPSAKVVYGKEFKEKMMVEFLELRIGKGLEVGVWARAVKELEERLIAMGKK